MVQPQQSKQEKLQPFKLEMRPDLDGLRAICVIAVTLCHLPEHLQVIKAGFLGLQVFFVMSGYLINAVVLRDLTRNNFSLRNFYQRRLKRILPNLMLCSVVSFTFGYLCTSHKKANQLSSSVIISFFTLNNFFSSLFEGHYWTLSIEQHFYLIWPLVAPFLLRQSFSKTMIILIIVSFVSFGLLMLKMLTNYVQFFKQGVTFFWTWNVMMGCMLTYMQYERQKKQSKELKQLSSNNELNQEATTKIQSRTQIIKSNKCLNQLFANIISIVTFVIFVLVLIFNIPFLPSTGDTEKTYFFVTRFFSALVGFILINYKSTYLSWFLSLGFLRFIGRQSYSIYLWHYPYIMMVFVLGVEDWVKGVLVIHLLISCFIQDRISEAKAKITIYAIIFIYVAIIAMMLTVLLTWPVNEQ